MLKVKPKHGESVSFWDMPNKAQLKIRYSRGSLVKGLTPLKLEIGDIIRLKNSGLRFEVLSMAYGSYKDKEYQNHAICKPLGGGGSILPLGCFRAFEETTELVEKKK